MVLVARPTPFVDTSDIRERVYTERRQPPQPLLIFAHPLLPPRNPFARNSLLPLEPRNHVSRPQLLLFPKLFSPSAVPGLFRLSRKELFVINLLADGRAIYLLGGPAPGNSLDQTQSFPSEWHARTSKLRLPNHRRYAPSVWYARYRLPAPCSRLPAPGSRLPVTGCRVMRENFGVRPMHHI